MSGPFRPIENGRLSAIDRGYSPVWNCIISCISDRSIVKSTLNGVLSELHITREHSFRPFNWIPARTLTTLALDFGADPSVDTHCTQ
jgi:hypothetical protein